MLTLICGLPRAGKTTYSENFKWCKVVHLDLCGKYEGVCNVISHINDDVVVEGIYDTAEKRKRLLHSYKGVGAKCIWMDTPLEIRKLRHGYHRNYEYFEPPSRDEGWDEVIRIVGENNVNL